MTVNEPDKIKKRKSWFLLYGQGAISGGISVLLAMGLYLLPAIVKSINKPDVLGIILVIALMFAVFGLVCGGIGGMLTGFIWNHDKAPIYGGVIISLILLAVVLGFDPSLLYKGS